MPVSRIRADRAAIGADLGDLNAILTAITEKVCVRDGIVVTVVNRGKYLGGSYYLIAVYGCSEDGIVVSFTSDLFAVRVFNNYESAGLAFVFDYGMLDAVLVGGVAMRRVIEEAFHFDAII